MVREHSLTQMDGKQENGKRAKNKVKEHSLGLMETGTKGNGETGKNMVKEHSFGLMETYTKGNTRTVIQMA